MYTHHAYVRRVLFCVQECYVPVELLISEEEAEEFEEWSSEEEEIVEKTAEVSWLLICINEKNLTV